MSTSLTHLLHSGYHHPTLREWQSFEGRVLTKSSLIYPIFISDNDDEKVEIKSMPGQYRFGINTLRSHFEPLVKKGLKTVLIFGVPVKGTKVGWNRDAEEF
ncbi:Aminolevulinate dehydratase [Irineochytrium annulatum]|nr:Aminolevulinate dehydratase [Irineochytrium annulatum]